MIPPAVVARGRPGLAIARLLQSWTPAEFLPEGLDGGPPSRHLSGSDHRPGYGPNAEPSAPNPLFHSCPSARKFPALIGPSVFVDGTQSSSGRTVSRRSGPNWLFTKMPLTGTCLAWAGLVSDS